MLSVFFPPDGWIKSPELRAAWQAVHGPATLAGIDTAYEVTNAGLTITLGYAPHEVLSEFKALSQLLYPWLIVGDILPNQASKYGCQMTATISHESFAGILRITTTNPAAT